MDALLLSRLPELRFNAIIALVLIHRQDRNDVYVVLLGADRT